MMEHPSVSSASKIEVVGGHAAAGTGPAILKAPQPGRLWKPYQELTEEQRAEDPTQKSRGDVEHAFYQEVYHAVDLHPTADVNEVSPLSPFLPKFYGCVFDEKTSSRFLDLEDVTANFGKPCVCDLKIGRRTYDETARSKKILSQSTGYRLQERIGFRCSGMSTFVLDGIGGETTGEARRIIHDHKWGKSLNETQVLEGLRMYFDGGAAFLASSSSLGCSKTDARRGHKDHSCESLVKKALDLLQQLKVVLETRPKYRLYATSVLFAYDAEDPVASLRMNLIDFAHVFHIQKYDTGTDFEKDFNFLFGLKSLMIYLKLIMQRNNEKR
ncbi:unnamed protein product [Amoebophrya sp. A120]|nr:unnamed protein product [Amoebophrya sp. A120]|eukprot:GSA120T00021282001.1